MALTIVVQQDLSIGGTKHLYWGTVAMDSSYPTGGEALDVAANTRFEVLMAQPTSGYVFQWDTANQLLKAYYADNNNAADGPLIEVPAATDLSTVTGIQFVAFGA